MRYLVGLVFVLALGCGGGEGGFPCTEQGIRDAIAEGGGPHTFACDGPTTVVTEAEIVIDNDVILDGEGNVTVDGDEDHRMFSVPKGVVAELRGFLVTGGTSGFQHDGGGINNNGTLTLTDSTVSGNTATGPYAYGGGVTNYGGTLTLINSTVSGNSAARGGGIMNYSNGTLTLINSTVSGNTADYGGGIHIEGTLTLTNSTVSGNTADYGGGIHNGGTLTLTNSTVSGNTAEVYGGGIFSNGTLTLTSSIVDGNCVNSAPLFSNGYNIESPGDTCGFDQPTDQVDVTEGELNLQPLADNGGDTMTHALGADSVAIDKIPADMCEVETDQRGQPRPGGTTCDVGAFEVQP